MVGLKNLNVMCGHISSWTLVGISVFALFTSSCEEEPKFDAKALSGRWELVKGLRNQKETETLSGTYFLFQEGEMQTNLPVGPEELIDYELDKNIIRQKNTPPVEYTIRELTDSLLILGLELRGMQFEMHFKHPSEQSLPDSFNSWPEEQLVSPGSADSSSHK
jgi:hypothetical protein